MIEKVFSARQTRQLCAARYTWHGGVRLQDGCYSTQAEEEHEWWGWNGGNLSATASVASQITYWAFPVYTVHVSDFCP